MFLDPGFYSTYFKLEVESVHKKIKKIRVSEWISVSQYVLSEEWESFDKSC